MAADKFLKLFAACELDVDVTRVTKNHGKAVDFDAIAEHVAKFAPVDLCGFAGLKLKAEKGLLRPHFSAADFADKGANGGDAAEVAELPVVVDDYVRIGEAGIAQPFDRVPAEVPLAQ